LVIGRTLARWRLVAPVVLAVVLAPTFATPALADDPPPGQTITVMRGGQTFLRTAFDVELAPDGRPMRAGSFIVKFLAQADPAARDEAHRIAGALGLEELLSADMLRVQVGRSKSLAALLAYASHRAVERVEPDYVAEAIWTPNDTSFGQQWGMRKIRAGSPVGSSDPSAWDTSKSSAATRIAILDCGVYSDTSSTFLAPDGKAGHPDLRDGKVIGNKNFAIALDSDDYCNHGTHVAGIAAANTNNGVGVAGVGYDAKILNVKVLGDNGSGSFAGIINGILYAAGCDTNPCGARRADIINMSLGATGSCSTSMQDAINKAWAQGLVIAAAAGNSGASGAITPANCNNVIGVAASDQNDAKASFSNHGAGVDVAAPGVSILSTDYVGGYSSFSGTSMASPHVAGLAALIWTTSYNTGNQAVVGRITSTENTTALAGSTHRRIDACAAVSCAVAEPPPPPPPAPLPTLSITDRSANEGNAGPTGFDFTVNLSAASAQTVTVNHATANGTASSSDYTAASGTLSLAPGETSKTITVSVSGDTAAEPNETFVVNLSAATNATIADAQGVGTIVNDDVPPPGDTGLRGPTANAAAGGGDGNGFQLNPANAHTNDGSFAVDANSGSGTSTSCTSSSKDKHVFRDYAFSIPSGSTIKGIEVRLDARVDSTSGSPRICAQLSWNGGSSWTAAKSTATLGVAEGTHVLGGATNTWERTWAVADFSNANFRVRVIPVSSSTSRDFSLEWVAVRVHH
jgi:thermitase